MKKVFLTLLAIGYLNGLYGLDGEEIPARIKVGTWNLEWFYDDDQGDNRSQLAKEKSAPSQEEWRWKLEGVAAVLGKEQPYIMAFQEVENRKVIFELKNILKSKYGLNYRIGFVEGFDTFTEQDVAVIFRDGLVEMSRKEQNTVQWKSKKFKNLSKHLFTRFEWIDGANRQELVLLNLHLRAMPDRENLRIQQCLLARDWIEQEFKRFSNVIVLGDLNTEHKYGEVGKRTDIGVLQGLHDEDSKSDLLDSHQFIKPPVRATHLTGKQYDRILYSRALGYNDPQRADFVFASAYVTKDPVIKGAPDVGDQRWKNAYLIPRSERDISDHYPLFAIFELK